MPSHRSEGRTTGSGGTVGLDCSKYTLPAMGLISVLDSNSSSTDISFLFRVRSDETDRVQVGILENKSKTDGSAGKLNQASALRLQCSVDGVAVDLTEIRGGETADSFHVRIQDLDFDSSGSGS